MSVVDDLRKLLEDLVIPDLKAVRAEVKANAETSKLRDEALSTKIDSKVEPLSALIVDHAAPQRTDGHRHVIHKG